MADLAISGVSGLGYFPTKSILLGEDAAAFDVMSLGADQQYFKAAADTEKNAEARGMILHAGLAGQYVAAFDLSQIVLLSGVTLTQGNDYFLSATPGKICDRADLISTNYITRLFTAATATEARFQVDATGVTVP